MVDKKSFYKKYGEEEVVFVSYYKHVFTFKNKNITVECSGSYSYDIYRFDVEAGKKYKIKDLEPNYAYKKDKLIFEELAD